MKIAIIGGGASGLACAIEAGQRAAEKGVKAEITVYEAKDRVGKKILATGNGRCNMMNINDCNYFGDNTFAKSVLHKFDVQSNLRFFEEMGLFTRADEEGRIYPLSNQASGVLDTLRFECERLGVKLITDCEITKVRKTDKGFKLNDEFFCHKLVICSGSKAQVKAYCGYELLRNLGHTVTKLSPSLTKLTVKNTQLLKALKGVRHKAEISLYLDEKKVTTEKGELLFADYGLSGIAVMQLSAFVARHFMTKNSLPLVSVDLIPDYDADTVKDTLIRLRERNPKGSADTLLMGFMPKKVGEAILKECGIRPDTSLDSLSNKVLSVIVATSKSWCHEISGTKDFSDGQVVSGGVLCKEFSSKTLESKKHKGLYCAGEIFDVDGLCGGYNLLWAWSSGRLCGESVIAGDNK